MRTPTREEETGRPRRPVPHRLEDIDPALIVAAASGDDSAFSLILRLSRPLLAHRARGYFILGAERDDLLQEAMVGLFRAIQDFRPERGAFHAFASLCVSRHLVSAVRAGSRRKHMLLERRVPLAVDEDGHQAADRRDPWEVAESSVRLEDLVASCRSRLTALEHTVLQLHLGGYSYRESARLLGADQKVVDNALQRARRKLDRSRKTTDG